MKIGWLVWYFDADDTPKFYKDGEEPRYCYKKIRIIYTEVLE